MISLRSVLREIPDTRGKKGRIHRLEAILGLILLSMLTGRTGMMAAYRLGRTLSRSQLVHNSTDLGSDVTASPPATRR